MTEPVNLISDTVTVPDAAMREAMVRAPVGDDVYGQDPTVNAFQERVAAMFGQEAALFMPTGSLSNIIGVATLTPPGTEVLCDLTAHIVRAELGAHAAVMGVTTRTIGTPNGASQGLLVARDLLAAATPNAGPYLVSTSTIAYENTHNFGGGRVQPRAEVEALYAGAQERELKVHLDGARIFNAMIATGETPESVGAHADSISVCFSKGLGAPAGSMLLGSRERIATARILRKRLGGGMRQVGILAAAMEYALDNNVDRLADDHAAALGLAQAAAAARPDVVNLDAVETNIVVFDIEDAPRLVAALERERVFMSALGPRTVRAVTHLNVSPAQAQYAAEVLRATLSAH